MSTSMDDIEAMLASIESKQVRCPVCNEARMGHGDDAIHLVRMDWFYRPVAFPLSGGIVDGDYDNEYTSLPACVAEEFFGGVEPAFLCCNNADAHPDGKAHWWRVGPNDIIWDPGLCNDVIEASLAVESGTSETPEHPIAS